MSETKEGETFTLDKSELLTIRYYNERAARLQAEVALASTSLQALQRQVKEAKTEMDSYVGTIADKYSEGGTYIVDGRLDLETGECHRIPVSDSDEEKNDEDGD